MAHTNGRVVAVNGNMVAVAFDDAISMNEVGYIHSGDTRLKGEVIRINGKTASMQVFESTNGVAVGDAVRITSGSFENFMAKVSAVDAEKNRVTVLAEMFGGDETPVELGFDEIEKI